MTARRVGGEHLLLWDLESCQLIGCDIGGPRIDHIAFSPDSQKIAAVCPNLQGNNVKIWTVSNNLACGHYRIIHLEFLKSGIFQTGRLQQKFPCLSSTQKTGEEDP